MTGNNTEKVYRTKYEAAVEISKPQNVPQLGIVAGSSMISFATEISQALIMLLAKIEIKKILYCDMMP